MQSVIQTTTFLTQAKRCGLSDDDLQEIVAVIAADPEAGVLMAGTGGARKLRHAREGQGKSGGFRTVHYFGGGGIPVFALAIYGKNEKGNLSKAERNELARILPKLADAYRQRKYGMTFGKELIQSAHEALAIAEGLAEPAAVFIPETIDVAAIRKRQKLSQAEFAKRYGLPAGTIKDWEQKRRQPDRAAILLLKVIEQAPDTVAQAIRA
jgi:DNA-binding transcriptional regulator YiaG